MDDMNIEGNLNAANVMQITASLQFTIWPELQRSYNK
jgi:hypothetical protein